MRHQKFIGLGSILGSVVLAGCGIHGHAAATPANNGTSQVRGTVHTSGVPKTNPSSSSSPSPATSVSRSSHGKLFKTHGGIIA